MGFKHSSRLEKLFHYVYHHQTLKERTKRFYDNINPERVEAIEEITKAITLTQPNDQRGRRAYYLDDSTVQRYTLWRMAAHCR